jgi:transposase-like protein
MPRIGFLNWRRRKKPLSSPKSLPDFMRMFPSENECEDYLFDLRWPKSFICPECESTKEPYWIESQRKVECANCGQHTYLTADTILHKTHTPLKTWFLAAYLVTTHTPGISAVQLQRQLGLSRYETAFQILHKLRGAMVNPDREPLHGEIEVDETYIGGHEEGARGGRGDSSKAVVVGAVERRYDKKGKRVGRHFYAGRIRMHVIENATADNLTAFVEDHIEEGSVVITDAWRGYDRLKARGYQHERIVQGGAKHGSAILPLIHLEFANLKTWLQGTHHGRVEEQHLQAYLNEFCFRHNRRFWPFTAFQTVLRLGMKIDPMTYEKLYSADEQGHDVHLGRIDLPDEAKG